MEPKNKKQKVRRELDNMQRERPSDVRKYWDNLNHINEQLIRYIREGNYERMRDMIRQGACNWADAIDAVIKRRRLLMHKQLEFQIHTEDDKHQHKCLCLQIRNLFQLLEEFLIRSRGWWYFQDSLEYANDDIVQKDVIDLLQYYQDKYQQQNDYILRKK